jgi:putative tryptophan/tyrosine transport system substrate-binding protein
VRIKRRAFVVGGGTAGLGLLAGCGRLPRQGQAPERVPRLGLLGADPAGYTPALLEGLAEYGYVEGQNLLVEYRYRVGADQPESFQAAAAELVALPVDVIVAGGGTPSAVAAKQVTDSVPIVSPTGDLLGVGLVASLGRPGGNVTGLTSISPALSGKRLELLRQALPALSQVAVLWNPGSATATRAAAETEAAARVLGLGIQSLAVGHTSDFAAAVEQAREQSGAATVMGDPITLRNRALQADLATRNRLPTMFVNRESVEAGGLMAYGSSITAQFRRAAYYVDRILRGTKPADLPVEQPMTFDFVVNMKTARELSIIFPNEIMLQVTEVIQ